MCRCHPLCAFAAVAALSLATVASADSRLFVTVNLSGAQEFPSNASTATGAGTAIVDTTANTLTYHLTFSGLTGSETGAHIHGFAAPGANATVLTPLPAGSPKDGVWNYSQAQEAQILAGLTYFNVHSGGFPGGEIRGQIVPLTPVPATSPWALAMLSVAFLVTGIIVVRRRLLA